MDYIPAWRVPKQRMYWRLGSCDCDSCGVPWEPQCGIMHTAAPPVSVGNAVCRPLLCLPENLYINETLIWLAE